MTGSIAPHSKMWHKILTSGRRLFFTLKEALRAQELLNKESKPILYPGL